jgi:hypothetical protein
MPYKNPKVIKEYLKDYYIKNKEGILKDATLYYETNKQKIKIRNKKYYQQNKEEIKKRTSDYREKNKDKVQVYEKNRYANNKENKLAGSKIYYQNNKEKLNKQRLIYQANRRKNNPSYRLICNVRRRTAGALKGSTKSARTMILLGIPDVEFLWKHLEATFKHGMTRENHGSIWQVDHKVPCSSFDMSDPEQQRKCFHYTNLQALFVHENLSKGAKIL